MKISNYKYPIFAWDEDHNDWHDSAEDLYSETECNYHDCEHYNEELCSIGEGENAKDLAQRCYKRSGNKLVCVVADKREIELKEIFGGYIHALVDSACDEIGDMGFEDDGIFSKAPIEELLKHGEEFDKIVCDFVASKLGKVTGYMCEHSKTYSFLTEEVADD